MKFCSLRSSLSYLVAPLVLLTATQVQAVAVDSEIVLLVDAQTSPQSDFDLILEGVAQSFEQQSFIDSVAAGTHGRIAASLILFNSASGQTTEIPWIELSSSADLQSFANTVRNVSNLSPGGNVSYAGAIAEGASQLATSVYQGTLRQLTIIDDGTGFFAANPSATQSARDAALASSTDVINAVIFDVQHQETTAANYYNANVVGGAGGTVAVVGSPQGGPKSTAVAAAIESAIVSQVSTPTVTTAAAIPEPSSLIFCLVGMGFLAVRRR